MSDLSQEVKSELEEQIKTLESQLTGNLFDDMDIKDQIHNIKMKINGVKPVSSTFECVGCGS
ncbi:hypothetical protein [Bacteriovorax sp. DB6_IX]|uniref:hypothetical protein n=1 Tax=Bacteriovorax sp. DB6_IX TaxID=1353530 RepID=UPI000389E109|nr:hypothetical protein [Bacteriovorax sp. DB6_IX]EQC44158.1 hypothetical protein M901_1975 [Bacteriovorax sp. DB6_IX]